jgi:hypothetical protein
MLRNAVAANLKREHRFVCVTDDPSALESGVEGLQMPEMGIPLRYQRRGCWPKLSIFAPNLLPKSTPTLYLDLDVVVRQNLDCFFDRLETNRGFYALREWNPTLWNLAPASMRPNRGVQGSILGFYPEDQVKLFDEFVQNMDAHCQQHALDQDYLTVHAKAVQFWPLDWTVSFKWHCVKYYPLNKLIPKIKEPSSAKIVVFHGKPRPIDVVPLGDYRWGTKRKFGHGPVDWVRDYWIRHNPLGASQESAAMSRH